MEPGTASLVLLGISAASTGASLISSRGQQKVEMATIELEREQAKLAASEQAYQKSLDFRSALSSQLALASLRGGAGLMTQFGSNAMANYLQDQKVLTNRARFIDISANMARATSKANRFTRDMSSIGQLASQGLNQINFNELMVALK